jgi:hypothetical protein
MPTPASARDAIEHGDNRNGGDHRYARDEPRGGFSVISRNVCKNLVEIGERTAFIPQFHALR